MSDGPRIIWLLLLIEVGINSSLKRMVGAFMSFWFDVGLAGVEVVVSSFSSVVPRLSVVVDNFPLILITQCWGGIMWPWKNDHEEKMLKKEWLDLHHIHTLDFSINSLPEGQHRDGEENSLF